MLFYIILEKIYKYFRNFFDIKENSIPIVIYTGSIENVPEIFARMNTGSVKLTKYEIFASKWDHIKVEMNNEEIKFVMLQYDLDLRDGKIERTQNEGTIFEFFISQSNKLLFNKNILKLNYKNNKNPENIEDTKYYEVDEIAFELISLVFKNSTLKINEVVNEISEKNCVDSKKGNLLREIISKFENILMELEHPTNNNIESLYSKYYLLVAVFKIKYEIDFSNYNILERNLNSEHYNKLFNFIMDIDSQKNNDWFVDKNRQVNFITGRLKYIEDLIADESLKPTYELQKL